MFRTEIELHPLRFSITYGFPALTGKKSAKSMYLCPTLSDRSTVGPVKLCGRPSIDLLSRIKQHLFDKAGYHFTPPSLWETSFIFFQTARFTSRANSSYPPFSASITV